MQKLTKDGTDTDKTIKLKRNLKQAICAQAYTGSTREKETGLHQEENFDRSK